MKTYDNKWFATARKNIGALRPPHPFPGKDPVRVRVKVTWWPKAPGKKPARIKTWVYTGKYRPIVLKKIESWMRRKKIQGDIAIWEFDQDGMIQGGWGHLGGSTTPLVVQERSSTLAQFYYRETSVFTQMLQGFSIPQVRIKHRGRLWLVRTTLGTDMSGALTVASWLEYRRLIRGLEIKKHKRLMVVPSDGIPFVDLDTLRPAAPSVVTRTMRCTNRFCRAVIVTNLARGFPVACASCGTIRTV